MTIKKIFMWFSIAVLPIVALWIYACLAALDGFERTCQELHRGYRCTRTAYIEDHVMNPFVAPGLMAVSVTWLLVVVLAAFAWMLFWRRTRGR